MGRKKIYPTNCSCCNPPVELKTSDSAQYHRKNMSNKKRSSTDSSAAVPEEKKQKTIPSFLKDLDEDGRISKIFKEFKGEALEMYIDFHLKELTADDRFSVRTKLLTDLDAALKNTVGTENYFKLHSAEFNQEDKDYVSCFKITDKFHTEYKTVEDLEAEDEKLNVMKKIIADELKERKAAPTHAMKKYITKRIDQIDKLHERLQVDELDDEPHSPHYMAALSGFLSRNSSSSSSSSSVGPVPILAPLPNSPPGMAITATTTTAQVVQVAKVEDAKADEQRADA